MNEPPLRAVRHQRLERARQPAGPTGDRELDPRQLLTALELEAHPGGERPRPARDHQLLRRLVLGHFPRTLVAAAEEAHPDDPVASHAVRRPGDQLEALNALVIERPVAGLREELEDLLDRTPDQSIDRSREHRSLANHRCDPGAWWPGRLGCA